VIGCDPQVPKVDSINGGHTPIEEPGLAERVARAQGAGLLSATTDSREAVRQSEVSLVCVGTPSDADGDMDLTAVRAACQQIGSVIGELRRPHTVAIRSTLLPHAVRETVIPTLMEAAGAGNGSLLRICVNPEFLREGSAVQDFIKPPMIVIGEQEPGSADALVELYEGINAPIFRVGIPEAMMVKYSSNIFHALKVIFANEIGAICQREGIDSHQVMDIFCRDTQLNISARYLRPGNPYGGSCLPKDLRALLARGRALNVETPVLSGISRSRHLHVERCVKAVLATGEKRLGVLGLSFKNKTDDLRESPTVEIVERLIGKGIDVAIHDNDITTARLFGANLSYVQQHLPHLATLMRPSAKEVIEHGGAVLLAKRSDEYANISTHLKEGQVLIDLVRFIDPRHLTACQYVSLVG
jgi:GDP-mannose 6-dehydrogenase